MKMSQPSLTQVVKLYGTTKTITSKRKHRPWGMEIFLPISNGLFEFHEENRSFERTQVFDCLEFHVSYTAKHKISGKEFPIVANRKFEYAKGKKRYPHEFFIVDHKKEIGYCISKHFFREDESDYFIQYAVKKDSCSARKKGQRAYPHSISKEKLKDILKQNKRLEFQ